MRRLARQLFECQRAAESGHPGEGDRPCQQRRVRDPRGVSARTDLSPTGPQAARRSRPSSYFPRHWICRLNPCRGFPVRVPVRSTIWWTASTCAISLVRLGFNSTARAYLIDFSQREHRSRRAERSIRSRLRVSRGPPVDPAQQNLNCASPPFFGTSVRPGTPRVAMPPWERNASGAHFAPASIMSIPKRPFRTFGCGVPARSGRRLTPILLHGTGASPCLFTARR